MGSAERVREAGGRLVAAFEEWLEVNKAVIGEKWYVKLKRSLRRVRTDDVVGVMGAALWVFNAVCNLGVQAGVGVFGVSVHGYGGLDKQSTDKLLNAVAECFRLQFDP